MFFYEGLKCPVCNKPFEESEDIVACPHCGLPHHRECWKQHGHCFAEDLHGTPEQWTRENTPYTAPPKHASYEGAETVKETDEDFTGRICPRCRTRNPEFAEICTHCGLRFENEDWHTEQPAYTSPAGAEYVPFHVGFASRESYSPEEKIGEFRAKELEAVVGQNAAYYIPRFRRIENRQGGGWNWAAFLLGPYWLLFRKQYLLGILYFFCQTVYSFACNYLLLPIQKAKTQAEMAEVLERMLLDKTFLWFFLPIFVLSVILFVGRILLGLKGNQLYKVHCERRIRAARTKTPDMSAGELSSIGGTSLLLAAVFYTIPTVLSYVLMLLQVM